MRLQNIFFPAPGAGLNAVIPVALEPGLCGMLVAAVFDFTAAGESQSFVTIAESAIGISICAFSDIVDPGLVQSVNAVLDVGSVPSKIPAALASIGVGIALPRVVCQQNFTVTLGSPTAAGADAVSAGRLVVAFGALWELAAL